MIFCESIDRLSRQKLLKTKSLIYDKILSKGVKIITTSDGAIYQDHEDPNEVFKQDLMISLIAQRANEESRIKSIRRKSAWNKAKSDISRPFNAHNPPYGIIYNSDKNCFEIDLEKQKELIELFTLLQDFGIKETIKRLNDNKNYRVWNNKLITNLFEYRYVLGLYKSQKRENGKKVFVEFIENYYPQLVPNILFDQAEKAMKERKVNKQYGVREENNINIFRHCLKCDYCGKTLILERQVNSQKKTYFYFNCASNRNISNSCPQSRFRFDYVFCALLKKIEWDLKLKKLVYSALDQFDESEVDSADKAVNEIENLFLNLFSKDKANNFKKQIDQLSEELSKKKHKYEILKNQLEAFLNDDVEDLDPFLSKKLSSISVEIKELENQISSIEILSKEETSGLSYSSVYEFIDSFSEEKGRLKINNYFIKNGISFRARFSINKIGSYISNDLLLKFYKNSEYITEHKMSFEKKNPIFKYYEYNDITNIATDIR